MALVVVFGAAGRQGIAQARQLKAAGHAVRAIARRPDPFLGEDLGEVEATGLGRQMCVKDDLEDHIAKLLGHVLIGRVEPRCLDRIVVEGGGEGFEGLERLIGLLQKVTGQGTVRLLLVPWAALPQGGHEIHEIFGSGPDRPKLRDVDTREMVCDFEAIQVIEVDRHDLLIGQAEMMEDHHVRSPLEQVDVDGELDVREHGWGVALGHEQRTRATKAGWPRGGIDHGQRRVERVEVKRLVGKIEEGERRKDHQVDVLN